MTEATDQDTPDQDTTKQGTTGQGTTDGTSTPTTGGDSRSAEKDPDDWATGDEPMTGPQRSYLETLAREAGRELPAELTKADASKLIEELQQQTGRGA
ncbi:DUF3072 domain-containing protein [Kineococcus glutinatus]|uniref:DUF3072 family protein n=1 Tax=Kineococcus glutinatus TaxID=1070872 RepID=A0ABP9I0C2_9ACTN